MSLFSSYKARRAWSEGWPGCDYAGNDKQSIEEGENNPKPWRNPLAWWGDEEDVPLDGDLIAEDAVRNRIEKYRRGA